MTEILGVRFIYKDMSKETQASKKVALTSAMLEKLPLELREQIADIARLLDTHAMEIKIAEVQKIDIATANGLQVLTQEFAFEQIMDLLTAAQGHE